MYSALYKNMVQMFSQFLSLTFLKLETGMEVMTEDSLSVYSFFAKAEANDYTLPFVVVYLLTLDRLLHNECSLNLASGNTLLLYGISHYTSIHRQHFACQFGPTWVTQWDFINLGGSH